MREVFGVSINSLSSVQYVIEKELGEKSTILIDSKTTKKPGSRIALIPSINAFKSNVKRLKDWSGIAIVFDSPVNLYSIKNLRWLDIKRQPDVLSYKFDFVEPKYSELFEAYRAKSKSKNIKFVKKDVLGALVMNRSETAFLEKWHNFLYFCTSHINREMCKKYLLEFFNDQITITKFTTNIKELLRENQVDYYQKDVLNWLKSEAGIRLKSAWLEAVKSGDIHKAAKAYELNVKDLVYLKRVSKVQKEIVKWK